MLRRALPALLVLAACARGAPGPATEQDEPATAGPPAALLPRVHLAGADGVEHAVTVEVVREPEELRRGMMNRRHLDADRGMLFLMGQVTIHTFWMKNTYVPLDIIFITEGFTVAGVAADARPLDEGPRYWVDEPSLYVLEVNAGWAAKRGVTKGSRVRFENVRGVP